MAEPALAARAPFAPCLVPGAHGVLDRGVGVVLTVGRPTIFSILAKRIRSAELEQAVAALGLSLPAAGQSVLQGASRLLWSGPEQWSVVGDRAEAERIAEACEAHALVVDQSDGRAVVAVSGPCARRTLAKGVPLDLHPRAFKTGMTALTTLGGVMVQIWQNDDAPTYEIALPRSFAEDFWAWLTHAAAEYGYDVVVG